MSNLSRCAAVLVVATLGLVAASAADLPPGATVLDPDLIWDRWDASGVAISPDGKSIAYISKGAIWICDVTTGPPTKLADVPGTYSALMSEPTWHDAHGDFEKLRSIMVPEAYQMTVNYITRSAVCVYSLQWTPSQDGVVYAKPEPWDGQTKIWTNRVRHASKAGVATTLATITVPGVFNTFHATSNKNYLICSSDGHSPLIWDAVADKPRATCFDYLLPSATSDRCLGVEIDTHQLVIADENFKVVKRFDVTLDLYRCNLTWSPDEKYAIVRISSEQPLDRHWTGFRINLETGQKRPLEGDLADRLVFTGHRGEVVRVGLTGVGIAGIADGGNGSRIEVIPDGEADQFDVVRFAKPYKPTDDLRKRIRYPPVRVAPDGSLFATAFPRAGEKPGYIYRLIDRDGNRWSLGDHDESLAVSPYYVLAIAGGGRIIVACDESQLFSIPVATIKQGMDAER